MTTPTGSTTTCPSCGATATGNFCSGCGASLATRSCAHCRAELTPRARFCHRCGRSVAEAHSAGRSPNTERAAWLFAATMSVLLLGAIGYKVWTDRPTPVTPDMSNTGAAGGTFSGTGPAPDISQMSPRERFDRLFNRIMQAAEERDSAQVVRFTPMALGAYAQLDTINVDARYHAAVLRLQVGDAAGARALADTILTQSPGHLFGYMIRGTVAALSQDSNALGQARRDFLAHYRAEMAANRLEYREHEPVIEEFRSEAGQRGAGAAGP
jgi:hypothetical protein